MNKMRRERESETEKIFEKIHKKKHESFNESKIKTFNKIANIVFIWFCFVINNECWVLEYFMLQIEQFIGNVKDVGSKSNP